MKKQPDLTLFAGDIVDSGDAFSQWQYFFNAIKDYGGTNLFMAAPGNHDAVHVLPYFKHVFSPLQKGDYQVTSFNQYVEIGNVLVAVWDTEDSARFEAQKKWLQEVTAKSKATYKIVLMHRSCYPMNYDEGYIRKLSDTFEACGIKLVLSGHDHIYNRTTMLKGSRVTQDKGVTYIVGGSGSGSKYYDETEIKGGRPWKQVVYDTNLPVHLFLTATDKALVIEAYAASGKGQMTLVDQLSIKATQQ